MSVNQPTLWLRIVALGGVALCLTIAACRRQPSTNLIGRAAPDFTLNDLDGNEVKLSTLRGKPVLIDFGASWCMPCAMAAPHLQALHEKYEDEGLRVIGISLDQSRDDARAFVRQHRITFPMLWADPNSQSVQELAEAINLGPIPRTLLIDSKGVVRADLTGLHSPEDLARELIKVGINTGA